jgi:N-acetylmuramoyl-L-alanine amidase
VQFSPVADGTIYNTPTYTATLAAKICLEGTSLSDNAMYFLNPKTAQSSWIVQNRKYAYTIGNHYFFL